jgi:signal transduction histidine kinase
VLGLAAGVPAALAGILAGFWPDAVPQVRTILLVLVNSLALLLFLRLPLVGSRAGVGARIALVGLGATVACQLGYLAAFLPLEPGSWLASRAWLLGFGDALWQPLAGFGLILWYLEHEHEAALEAAAEARRNAAALVESRKLHTIHLLSGGLMHDCINAMAVVLGCGELLNNRLADDEEARELLDSIRASARRASELARRGFATGQAEPATELSVQESVSDAALWLRHLLGPGVQLQLEIDADAPAVFCRRSDLQQILANLAVNARDALAAGGCVWIRVKRAPGPALLWEFEDDGPGIDPTIRDRLFEPFVSTKESSLGSGIGLASVRACVGLMGGTIRAVERSGGGTRFELSIPAARAASRVPAQPKAGS